MVAAAEANKSLTATNERPSPETQSEVSTQEKNPFGLSQQEVFELGKWKLTFVDGPANPQQVKEGQDFDTLKTYTDLFPGLWSRMQLANDFLNKTQLAFELMNAMRLPTRDIFNDWRKLKANQISQTDFEEKYNQPLSTELIDLLKKSQ